MATMNDGSSPDYAGAVGTTPFSQGSHSWQLTFGGDSSGMAVGVCSTDMELGSNRGPTNFEVRRGKLWWLHESGQIGQNHGQSEPSGPNLHHSRGIRRGSTMRIKLDCDAGEVTFCNDLESNPGNEPGVTLKGIDCEVVPFVYFDYSGSSAVVSNTRGTLTTGSTANTELSMCTAFVTASMHRLLGHGDSSTYVQHGIAAVQQALHYVQEIARVVETAVESERFSLLRRCLAETAKPLSLGGSDTHSRNTWEVSMAGTGQKKLGLVVQKTSAGTPNVGVFVKELQSGGMCETAVANGARLQPGDEIVAVGGESVEGFSFAEAAEVINAHKERPLKLTLRERHCSRRPNESEERHDLQQMIGFPADLVSAANVQATMDYALALLDQLYEMRTDTGVSAAAALLPVVVATLAALQQTFEIAPQIVQHANNPLSVATIDFYFAHAECDLRTAAYYTWNFSRSQETGGDAVDVANVLAEYQAHGGKAAPLGWSLPCDEHWLASSTDLLTRIGAKCAAWLCSGLKESSDFDVSLFSADKSESNTGTGFPAAYIRKNTAALDTIRQRWIGFSAPELDEVENLTIVACLASVRLLDKECVLDGVEMRGALLHAGKQAAKVKRHCQDIYREHTAANKDKGTWAAATEATTARARLLLDSCHTDWTDAIDVPSLQADDETLDWEFDNSTTSPTLARIRAVARFLLCSLSAAQIRDVLTSRRRAFGEAALGYELAVQLLEAGVTSTADRTFSAKREVAERAAVSGRWEWHTCHSGGCEVNEPVIEPGDKTQGRYICRATGEKDWIGLRTEPYERSARRESRYQAEGARVGQTFDVETIVQTMQDGEQITYVQLVDGKGYYPTDRNGFAFERIGPLSRTRAPNSKAAGTLEGEITLIEIGRFVVGKVVGLPSSFATPTRRLVGFSEDLRDGRIRLEWTARGWLWGCYHREETRAVCANYKGRSSDYWADASRQAQQDGWWRARPAVATSLWWLSHYKAMEPLRD